MKVCMSVCVSGCISVSVFGCVDEYVCLKVSVC